MKYASGSTSVLVVEDQMLIAMDLEWMLQDLGYSEVVVVPSCAEAKAWLSDHKPAFAILDVLLRDGSSETVATELVAQGVRFIVSSGSGFLANADVFAHGIHVPKPCSLDFLASAVRSFAITHH